MENAQHLIEKMHTRFENHTKRMVVTIHTQAESNKLGCSGHNYKSLTTIKISRNKYSTNAKSHRRDKNKDRDSPSIIY